MYFSCFHFVLSKYKFYLTVTRMLLEGIGRIESDKINLFLRGKFVRDRKMEFVNNIFAP